MAWNSSPEALSAALGVPVVSTVAVRKRGLEHLLGALTLLVGESARWRCVRNRTEELTERRDWAQEIWRGHDRQRNAVPPSYPCR
jgi:Fe2+ transport system protein B